MSPALLLPLGLGALAALLIPMVIHIARRTESRTIAFAALRWLEARPKPRRRFHIDERLLLAARLALLAAIALWLAQPVLWNVADARPVVAVAPGVPAATIAEAVQESDRVVWLSPGFPEVGGGTPGGPGPVVSLIRQLDAELAPETPVQVIVPATLDGVDAERPRLSRRVAWRVGPEGRSTDAPPVITPINLTVRHGPEQREAVRYFRAAATAWTGANAAPAFEAAGVDRPLGRGVRHLVWLAPGPLLEPVLTWIRAGGTALVAVDTRAPVDGETRVAWRDDRGEPLAVSGRLGQGRVIRLTRPLEPAAIPQLVEPAFPDDLARILSPPPAPARVPAAEHAPLAGAASYAQPPLDLRSWLALMIVLLFAVERWMATRPRRALAP